MKYNLFTFIFSYIIFFIIYLIFYYFKGLRKKGIINSLQIKFITIRSGVSVKKLNIKKLGLIICLLDPLIISLSSSIAILPNLHFLLEILIGFVLLLIFIFSFYEILSRIIRWKEDRK